MSATLGRFGHNPDALIDYLIEIEELQSIAESERLGLTGFGHEEDYADMDRRIEKALEFRVGGDQKAVECRDWLKALAISRGFNLLSEIAYCGQSIPRTSQSGDARD